MKPPCNAFTHGLSKTYRCDASAGHLGSHLDSRYMYVWSAAPEYTSWFQKEWEGVTDVRYKAKVTGEFPVDPEETSVLLTLEDLKVIAYYLPSDGNDDDAPTVAKIEEALKELL